MTAAKHILHRHRGLLVWGLALLGGMMAAVPSYACNVPVFRYALEKWAAGNFDVYIFSDGPLSAEQQAAFKLLHQAADSESVKTNLKVELIDLKKDLSKNIAGLFDSLRPKELPCMAVLYPVTTRINVPFWSGPLTQADVKALLDSPLRKNIADQILKGTSGVWVLLKSGDKQKDEAAANLLDGKLKHLEKKLKLPQLTDDPEDKLDSKDLPLKLKFSMVQLDRNDPAESVFVEMLLRSEPGLKDDPEFSKEPMVFPVFGRGRAMYGLIGKGINEDNIFETANFLIGPCTCKVKEQNPGFDLLMTASWDSILGERQVKEFELPPLPGITKIKPVAGGKDSVETVTVSLIKPEISPFERLQKELAMEQAEMDRVMQAANAKTESGQEHGSNSSGPLTTTGSVPFSPSANSSSNSDSSESRNPTGADGMDSVIWRNTIISILIGVIAVGAAFLFTRLRSSSGR